MAAVAVVISMAASAFELSLSDFVLSGARPKGIGTVEPAKQGKYYYQQDGNRIMRRAYADTKTEEVVLDQLADGVEDWDGYQMSSNERSILLWTASNPIYRYSFTADYYVYVRDNGQLLKLSEAGGEEIATLSPDGRRVAYVKDNNVYIRDLDSPSPTQITRDGEKNKIIYGVPDWVYQEEFGMLNSLCWSPDGNTLAFIRWDESQVPMYSMTMYEGDCHANADYALYPGSFDYKYPVAGEKNSVVNVITCDVTTGAITTMPLPIGDDGYIPHMAFSTRNDALMVSTLNRTQNDFNIYRVNPATAQVRSIYHETSTSWIDSELMNQVLYVADIMLLPSERNGWAQLMAYDLDGNLMRELTPTGENVTNVYGYDAKRAAVYYQTTAGPLNRQIKCTDLKGKVRDITPATGTYSGQFNSDFTYYIQSFSDANTPTQYRLKTTAGKLVRDLQLNEEYAARYTAVNIPKREFVSFESDGYKINGYIIKPVDFDPAKRYPVIMSQYSGPGSQQVLNKWKMDWEEYFATQGYVVAVFDGRGTGGREKAFQAVVYQNLGHYETIDQLAAAAYMASQPWVDAEHIGIWGWSFGGYEALMAMSHPDAHYAAGVSIAPVTSWRFYDTIYAERYMRTPQENPTGFEQSAPLNKVEDLKGELLIMFGSADDNVHIINSMQYIAKLHGQKRQFEMMVYPNMNHSINGCGVREPLYQRVLNFFNRTLKK